MQVRNEDVREVLDIFLEDRRNVISMMERDLPEVLEKLQKNGKLLDYDLLRAKAKAEISQRLINLVENIKSFVKKSAGTQTSIGNLDFAVQIQRKGLNGMLSEVKRVEKIEQKEDATQTDFVLDKEDEISSALIELPRLSEES